MEADWIHDRGRGPEIIGTRITVYNLLPDFLDATVTEAAIASRYDLTMEQVAAARAHILIHADAILAEHLRIEARIAKGNPPEVVAQAQQTRTAFLQFRDWVRQQKQAVVEEHPAGSAPGNHSANGPSLPTFREWLADQEVKLHGGR